MTVLGREENVVNTHFGGGNIMKDNKWEREEIHRVGGTEIVYAKETESPDYWLLGDNGEQFGIFKEELEDVIEVLKAVRELY